MKIIYRCVAIQHFVSFHILVQRTQLFRQCTFEPFFYFLNSKRMKFNFSEIFPNAESLKPYHKLQNVRMTTKLLMNPKKKKNRMKVMKTSKKRSKKRLKKKATKRLKNLKRKKPIKRTKKKSKKGRTKMRRKTLIKMLKRMLIKMLIKMLLKMLIKNRKKRLKAKKIRKKNFLRLLKTLISRQMRQHLLRSQPRLNRWKVSQNLKQNNQNHRVSFPHIF